MVLGPLDKRALRTRCKACAQRRIKCHGGRPCVYCTKKEISCIPQAAKTRQLVILNHTPPESSRENTPVSGYSQSPSLHIDRVYSKDVSNQFINHFFVTFMINNGLGVMIDTDAIISQFQSSPSLYHASIAVGALDLSRRHHLHQPNASVLALKSYRTSVINFQSELQERDFLKSDEGLWTTLFLGLFELMYDVTGEGWVKHILYGTSQILQIRGPEAHLTGRGRSFFLAVRVFEICRSLIYSQSSFLHEDPWKEIMDRIWEGNLIVDWHPKEALFDLMLACSDLNQLVWEVINPENTSKTDDEIQNGLLATASMGLLLRGSLESWQINFQTWKEQSIISTIDPRSVLAKIYYHSISIYLSGLFDYHSQYNEILNPTLQFETVQFHVNEILNTATEALLTTNLAGILFFFPLRVAGARAVTSIQKALILGMLREISKRSYIVADAFVEDLQGLWGMVE